MKEINEVYIDTRYPSDVGLIASGKPSKTTVARFVEFIRDLDQILASAIK